MGHKKNLLSVLLIFAVSQMMAQNLPEVVYSKLTDTYEPTTTYLLVYHKDETHSLYMALSADGYSFTDVNKGNPIMGGDSISEQRGVRDPHISRGPDGTFYLVATDLNINAKEFGYRKTQWERDEKQYGWGNNKSIVLMTSSDLIHWNHRILDVSQSYPDLKDISVAWAPETIYDSKEKKMMLFYSSGFGPIKKQVYYTYMNKDFTKMDTHPKLLFEYPHSNASCIDADIIKVGDKYHLFFKTDDDGYGHKGIKHAVSSSINKGYVIGDSFIDHERKECEAPNAWKRIGKNAYVVMTDVYMMNPHTFGFVETTDFKTFTHIGHFNDGAMKATNFDKPKHGAVIQLTKKEAIALIKYWNMNNIF